MSIEIYAIKNILKEVDHDTFINLCSTNKLINDLCEGNLSEDYGNLTEELYKERVDKFFSPDIIAYKNFEPNISSREFYWRMMDLTELEKDKALLKLMIDNNKIIEVNILLSLENSGTALQQRIRDFEDIMNNHLMGNDNKILNVSKYDIDTFTNVRKVDKVPYMKDRINPISPIINVTGRLFTPIIYLPNNRENYINYVKTVIANSKYRNLVPEFLNQ